MMRYTRDTVRCSEMLAGVVLAFGLYAVLWLAMAIL